MVDQMFLTIYSHQTFKILRIGLFCNANKHERKAEDVHCVS